MPSYICDNCEKEFTSITSLKYHTTHNACKIKSHNCKACEKTFSSESSMYRHMRTSCTVKKQQDAEKETILNQLITLKGDVEQLKLENEKLRYELGVAKHKRTTNNIGTINKNTNKGVVINNNITLVGYGKEDLTKMEKSELLRILQQGYQSTVKLTEAVHFNPKYPENHNVYISNMKDKYAMTFDGKDWNLTMKEDLINKIYDDKKNYIEENLDNFVDSLSTPRKRALDRWLETDDDDEKITNIKNEIKLLLYNKRHMILDGKQKVIEPEAKKTKNMKKSRKIPKDDLADYE